MKRFFLQLEARHEAHTREESERKTKDANQTARKKKKKMRKTKKPKIRTSFNHYLVFLAWTSLGVNSARSSMVIRCAIVKILILYYGVWSQYSRLEFLLFSYLTIQHRNCIFYYSTSFFPILKLFRYHTIFWHFLCPLILSRTNR